jgi:hypothetical protein
MTSLAFETDEMKPVRARCADGEVYVALDAGELNDIELIYEGIWWTAIDEGISVKSMFLGIKAPGATAPEKAA